MAGGRSPAVLIVDDSEGVCAAVSMLLESEGFEVDSALSYEEALAAVERSRFDILLVDVNLGGRSGVELIPKLVARVPSAKPILMTGSHVDDLSHVNYPKLQKPFTRQELVECLRRAIERAA